MNKRAFFKIDNALEIVALFSVRTTDFYFW